MIEKINNNCFMAKIQWKQIWKSESISHFKIQFIYGIDNDFVWILNGTIKLNQLPKGLMPDAQLAHL